MPQQIATLSAGQRFWFWMSDAAAIPLQVTSVADDPHMHQLLSRVRHTEGAPQPGAFGVGHIDAGGHVHLFGEALTEAHFEVLVAFVYENIDAVPALARLCGARLHATRADRTVRQTFRDDAIWPTVLHQNQRETPTPRDLRVSSERGGDHARPLRAGACRLRPARPRRRG